MIDAKYVLFLLLFTCGALRAQPTTEVKDFFLDPAGKAYFLLSDDRLVTTNRLGENTYSYYDSSLGSPDLVDVSNPFNILVYYQEYGTVQLLDRTLSELRRIDLFANPAIEQPGAIARSYDNGIWVFDAWDYRLLRLDERGKVDQRTNDLRLELQVATEPDAILVDRGAVVLYFAGEGRAAVFSNFGQFQRWVNLPPADRVSWNSPRLLGITDQGGWMWTSELPVPEVIETLPPDWKHRGKLLATPAGVVGLGERKGTTITQPYPEK